MIRKLGGAGPASECQSVIRLERLMLPPWHELKQVEMRALESLATGPLDAEVVARLRTLFDRCKSAPYASDAICYHGAIALILEFDGDFDAAITHRKIEISKIRELHDLARKNDGDRPALVNYQEQDLQHRVEILNNLQRRRAR